MSILMFIGKVIKVCLMVPILPFMLITGIPMCMRILKGIKKDKEGTQ